MPRRLSLAALAAAVALPLLVLPAVAQTASPGRDSAGAATSTATATARKKSPAKRATTKSTAAKKAGTRKRAATAPAAPAAPKLPPSVRDSAAVAHLWPVKMPAPLPGSILPARRIVAYYGNPLSKRMGVLGEYPADEMLARLDREVARWNRADPAHPVQPALHLIAVVAQGDPGRSGKWRTRMADTLVERVASWAARRNAIVFVDVQVGTGSLREELPALEKFLARPNFHLGIDPEFSMKGGHRPGSRIGTFDAADINYATAFLAGLVAKHNLPPKVLVVHRFTRPMVTNTKSIRLDPRVQIVMHMDGWGPQTLKRDSYVSYVAKEPVQFTGFKIFYKNDQRTAGSRVMTPEDVLRLYPRPLYIQYQ